MADELNLFASGRRVFRNGRSSRFLGRIRSVGLARFLLLMGLTIRREVS